jgi:hypothetical protein
MTLVVGGPATAAVRPESGVAPCSPCFAITSVKVTGIYRESRLLNGALVIAGRSDLDARVTMRTSTRPVGDPGSLQLRYSVPAGEFTKRFPLGPSFPPDSDEFISSDVTFADGTKRVFYGPLYDVKGPPEGFVFAKYHKLKSTSDGSRITRIDAEFWFWARPHPGVKMTATWYFGRRRVASPVRKDARGADYIVRTFVASPGGLSRGRWICVMRGGTRVVSRMVIRTPLS